MTGSLLAALALVVFVALYVMGALALMRRGPFPPARPAPGIRGEYDHLSRAELVMALYARDKLVAELMADLMDVIEASLDDDPMEAPE